MAVISSKQLDSSQPLTPSHLKKRYYPLELTGILASYVLVILIINIPDYFVWIEGYLTEAALALFLIGSIHLTLLLVDRFSDRTFFLILSRYAYIIFFFYLISITGGIDSSFIFLLLFPVITSAVYLEKTTIRNMGVVITVCFGAMILFVPIATITSAVLTKHFIQVILLGIISYLFYIVVIETLRQKALKEETGKKLTELVKLDQLKRDFLSVAQHQLRTPLSGVKWALEMLKAESKLPPDSLSLIDAGLDRVKDSIAIINQMLLTVEAEDDTVMLVPEQIDLAGMVRSIVAELNFIILKKEVKLTLLVPDSLMILADRNRMKASLINIIDNAIKYSPKGSVGITLVENPANVVLTVKDSGIGISPDDMPYIFDRLHRGKNAVSIEPDESGVGLYTSKKMIELHGGTISVASEFNKGTTVTVVLPKH